MVKSNSRQGKHRESENLGITQGKHRDLVKIKKLEAEKWLCDVDCFMIEVSNGVILLQKYTGKIEIIQGKHRENAENFTFQIEWEP